MMSLKKDVYNVKIKNNLDTNTTLNAKINQVRNKIPCITNLATTTTSTALILE